MGLCRELDSRGITPVLVFVRPLPEAIEQRLVAGGAVVKFIRYERGVLYFYWHLRRIIRKHRIGAVHIIFFDYFSPVAWIARIAGVTRIVYEMQNSGVLRARSWRLLLLRLRTRIMSFPVTHVIAISDFIKHQLVLCGFSADKFTVRYLGVDIRRFAPDTHARREWRERFHVQPPEVVLSSVTYLRAFKHPEVIVEACRHLANRGVAFQMFIAGDGEMLEEMKNLATELGVGDRIHWLGHVPDPERLLRGSDIFVLASVGEAFGLVLTEAMACGNPVVGSLSGSHPEVVENGTCGLLVPPLNGASLADAIARLAADRELRRGMASQAVDRVRKCFTVERSVWETIQAYERLNILSGHDGQTL